MSGLALILAAFAGSLLSVGFILILSRRLRHMAVLLVAGIMIGYICSAVTDFVITFARESDIVNLHGWSQGSFSGMTWQNVGAASAMVAVGVLAVFGMAKPIGAYQLGEGYARSMGVNIKVFRTALIVLSSLLSACVTAFAGPISFVGIAVPHLARARAEHGQAGRGHSGGTFLGGAVFCMRLRPDRPHGVRADGAVHLHGHVGVRRAGGHRHDAQAKAGDVTMAKGDAVCARELSISTVTSVFGAPVAIGVVLRRRRET